MLGDVQSKGVRRNMLLKENLVKINPKQIILMFWKTV